MDFNQLSVLLNTANEKLYRNAVKAVNINLTIRNWLFGFYIVEFEQNGEDRAAYGKKLLQNLAANLQIKGLTAPELSRCRQFYFTYPEFRWTVSQNFQHIIPPEILGSLTQKSDSTDVSKSDQANKSSVSILGSLPQEFDNTKDQFLAEIISSISYTHLMELIKIEDPLKRKFYELLILKTQPSVRELKRQIETLTFERFGLSGNRDLAFKQIQHKIEPEQSIDLVKSHYFFEFLKINQPQLIEESELEQALISHLKEFIIELGNGFCFEARQKRVLIGDEYYFIDLVFYHRILKCHVLIDLKSEKAKHEHIGQLRTYIHYYKEKIMLPADNPPVGILLVTDMNSTLVEYAIADSDKDIFVSKYQLALPDKKDLENFIQSQVNTFKNKSIHT